jgi:enoyl-CoA hydratase
MPNDVLTPGTENERFVDYMVADHVAWITLQRPEYSNAQNCRMLDQLDACFKRASDDDDVKVIVLGAEGKHFSAGHDLGTPGKDSDRTRDRKSLWYDHVGRPGVERQYVFEQDIYLGYCRRWRELPKPVIAMVQGACIAGGVMLAWVCDLIITSEDAYFQDPTVLMGFPGGEYFAHPFELPPRVAREFLLMGERLSAERAHHFGMVSRVVPRNELRSEVAKVAAHLAERPAFGLMITKQALNYVEDLVGKRSAIDGVFHMHQLAHAHNQMLTGSVAGALDAKAMKQANKR